jgi:hypothetical protein
MKPAPSFALAWLPDPTRKACLHGNNDICSYSIVDNAVSNAVHVRDLRQLIHAQVEMECTSIGESRKLLTIC